MKRALITGIGGQDGSYLADILLEKGYEVHGLYRRSSGGNLRNLSHILDRIVLHQGDVTDYGSVQQVVYDSRPDEVYHEADQDNVDWSFKLPAYTIDVTIKGTFNVLECMKYWDTKAKVFIPCSAMMFGDASAPQTEQTPFNPQSPYACAKVAVYHMARYYRQVHGMFVVNGILYNHDSPRRHGNYLLHRICRAAATKSKLKMYSVDDEVTIGSAKDYMGYVYETMQHGEPDDYIIDTPGRPYSIKELIDLAYRISGVKYRDYLELNSADRRPGNKHQLRGLTTRFQNLNQTTDYTPVHFIIKSLLEKYKCE